MTAPLEVVDCEVIKALRTPSIQNTLQGSPRTLYNQYNWTLKPEQLMIVIHLKDSRCTELRVKFALTG
ncbi:hypothetical protein B5X24_HaOG215909 [Helicoverpa armigera]|nr:hypothetical protein B5X24_HaOG215909 [Helicoverpa armigera]